MGKKSKLERAQSLHVRGRLAEAEALYREVLRVQPYQVEALEGLGVLTFHLGRSEEARALFAQGVAIVPDSARLHANLGEVLRILGRPDEAAGEVQRALVLDPGLAQSWNVLGHLAHDQKRYDDAVTAYREAIRLSSTSALFVLTRINQSGCLDGIMEVGSKFHLDPERKRSCSPYPKPLCRCSARSPGLASCRRPSACSL